MRSIPVYFTVEPVGQKRQIFQLLFFMCYRLFVTVFYLFSDVIVNNLLHRKK